MSALAPGSGYPRAKRAGAPSSSPLPHPLLELGSCSAQWTLSLALPRARQQVSELVAGPWGTTPQRDRADHSTASLGGADPSPLVLTGEPAGLSHLSGLLSPGAATPLLRLVCPVVFGVGGEEDYWLYQSSDVAFSFRETIAVHF